MNWLKLVIKTFNWIADNVKLSNTSHYNDQHETRINPATGLPMVNSGIDVAGNPFGSNFSDMHRHNHHNNHYNNNSTYTGGYDPLNNRY